MPTLLVTGFEPFGDFLINPSGTVAGRIDGVQRGGITVKGAILPVSWLEAWPLLEALVTRHSPIALLMLGAAKRPRIELELVAKNRNGKTLDMRGVHAQGACRDAHSSSRGVPLARGIGAVLVGFVHVRQCRPGELCGS